MSHYRASVPDQLVLIKRFAHIPDPGPYIVPDHSRSPNRGLTAGKLGKLEAP